jgi:hypothetical protein
MKLTPQSLASLKDNSKWANFTFTDDPGMADVDDGNNF